MARFPRVSTRTLAIIRNVGMGQASKKSSEIESKQQEQGKKAAMDRLRSHSLDPNLGRPTHHSVTGAPIIYNKYDNRNLLQAYTNPGTEDDIIQIAVSTNPQYSPSMETVHEDLKSGKIKPGPALKEQVLSTFDGVAVISTEEQVERIADATLQQLANIDLGVASVVPSGSDVTEQEAFNSEFRPFVSPFDKNGNRLGPAELKAKQDKELRIAFAVYENAKNACNQTVNKKDPHIELPTIIAGLTPEVNNPNMHDAYGYTNEFTSGAVLMPCEDWSPLINDAWIYGALKGGAALAFVSHYTGDQLANAAKNRNAAPPQARSSDDVGNFPNPRPAHDPKYFHIRVSGREIAGPLAAGYQKQDSDVFGTVLVPPKNYDSSQVTYRQYVDLIGQCTTGAAIDLALGKTGAQHDFYTSAIGQSSQYQESIEIMTSTANSVLAGGTEPIGKGNQKARIERNHKMYIAANNIVKGNVLNLDDFQLPSVNVNPPKQIECCVDTIVGKAASYLKEMHDLDLGGGDIDDLQSRIKDKFADGSFDTEAIDGVDTVISFLDQYAQELMHPNSDSFPAADVAANADDVDAALVTAFAAGDTDTADAIAADLADTADLLAANVVSSTDPEDVD